MVAAKLPGPWVKLSGTVTDSVTKNGIAGATITLQATGATITMVTDANGDYSNNKVPVGSFTMTTSATNYTNVVQQVNLLKGRTTVDVIMALGSNSKVVVNASVTGAPVPGATLTGQGSCVINDGSTLISSGWSQGAEGVPANIASGNAPSITLENVDVYAAHLIHVLKEPPVTAADLPPDLVLQPINQIEKGLQNRNQVVAINPMAMEHAVCASVDFHVRNQQRHIHERCCTYRCVAVAYQHRRRHRADQHHGVAVREGRSRL